MITSISKISNFKLTGDAANPILELTFPDVTQKYFAVRNDPASAVVGVTAVRVKSEDGGYVIFYPGDWAGPQRYTRCPLQNHICKFPVNSMVRQDDPDPTYFVDQNGTKLFTVQVSSPSGKLVAEPRITIDVRTPDGTRRIVDEVQRRTGAAPIGASGSAFSMPWWGWGLLAGGAAAGLWYVLRRKGMTA